MDPNKIHIDELVRQRLQGGDEEPRPGAWISMRELLDKQMPAGGRPLGGFAWGNATRWTTALVLLTLLAGGYGAMDIRRASRDGIVDGGSAPKNAVISAERSSDDNIPSSTGNAAPRVNGGVAAPATASSQDEAATPRTTTTNTVTGYSSASYSSSAPSRTRSPRHTPLAKADVVSPKAGDEAGANVPTTSSSGSERAASLRNSSSRAGNTPTGSLGSITNLENTPSNTTTAPKPEKVDAIAATHESRRTSENRAVNTTASTRRARQPRETSAVSNPATVASATRAESPRSLRNRRTRAGRTATVTIPDSVEAQVHRDTVQTIRIAHRYMSTRGVRGGRYVVDTLDVAPSIIERPLPAVAATSNVVKTSGTSQRTRRTIFGKRRPAPVEGLAAAPTVASKSTAQNASVAVAAADARSNSSSTSTLNPAASAPLASSAAKAVASEALVPLSAMKVSSTKSAKMQYSAQEQIQDVMRRTQFLFGQMRLYTGVTGGFNASVGGTSMGGFHAGIFGLLAINDRWSAGIEGKFVQRFNRGTELHDPYYQYTARLYNSISSPTGEAYKVYRVTTDSFNHYYKLSTIETVEFPVYARYSFRRFHAFGGANLTYGLRVKNIERVERFAGRESGGLDTVLASALYAPPANTAATVKLEDFGPRFGLGYTAGLGYQASPAVLVDVRMTQLLWDNRSVGAGGLRVSQTYYRVPSLQLSIGYRFSQRMGRR